MERLSCLADDNYQNDANLCDIFWKAVEGEQWAHHSQPKQGIEFVVGLAVGGISDSIQKHIACKAKNNSHGPILYGDCANKMTYDGEYDYPTYS